uniref:ubiquitinyl hydrolase 1 n=1 Tax=viral metagenome TaxID=1070528 RepID=A0A6C0DB14_9ZZZZ
MSLELGISRFKNIDGVSCYMISILHILQQIPSFVDFLIKNDFNKYIKKKTKVKKIENFVIYQLYRTIKLSTENDNIRISPNSLKKIVGIKDSTWAEYQHQDSQEFYTFLINTLEEECGVNIINIPKIPSHFTDLQELENNELLRIIGDSYIRKAESKDYSPIKELFIGYLLSNISCEFCSSESPSFESFTTLPISIPIKNNTHINKKFTLEECINKLTKNEKLDKFNKYNCEICGLSNRSNKKIQFWKSPKILVIQLKRFVTNAFGVPVSKIINPVSYPIEDFDISSYFHPNSPYINNSKYSLIGVNIHREFGSVNAGHYISILKNRYDNEWYLFDDSNDAVKISASAIQNRSAYLLFYYKSD